MISNDVFTLEWHRSTGEVEALREVKNPTFNWTRRGKFGLPSGLQFLDKQEETASSIKLTYQYFSDIKAFVTRELTTDGLVESYEFLNDGKKEVTLKKGELGVYVTLADGTDIEEVMPRRSVSQIWCGGNCAYVKSGRLTDKGGLALLLTEGYVDSYVIERTTDLRERGDIIFEIPERTLKIGESVTLKWVVFPYADDEEFYAICSKYPTFLKIDGAFSAAKGKELILSLNADSVTEEGTECSFSEGKAVIDCSVAREAILAVTYGGGYTTEAVINVYDLPELTDSRLNRYEPLLDKKNEFAAACAHLALLCGAVKVGYATQAILDDFLYAFRARYLAGGKLTDNGKDADLYKQATGINALMLATAVKGDCELSSVCDNLTARFYAGGGDKLMFYPYLGMEVFALPSSVKDSIIRQAEQCQAPQKGVFDYRATAEKTLIAGNAYLLTKNENFRVLLEKYALMLNAHLGVQPDYRLRGGVSFNLNWKGGDFISAVGAASFYYAYRLLEDLGLTAKGAADSVMGATFALYRDGMGYKGYSYARKTNEIEGGKMFEPTNLVDFALGCYLFSEGAAE